MAINKGVGVATLAEENKTNIALSIESITNSRNTIRNKLIDFGLAQNNDQLAALATAINGIVDNGSVQANVKEGKPITSLKDTTTALVLYLAFRVVETIICKARPLRQQRHSNQLLLTKDTTACPTLL